MRQAAGEIDVARVGVEARRRLDRELEDDPRVVRCGDLDLGVDRDHVDAHGPGAVGAASRPLERGGKQLVDRRRFFERESVDMRALAHDGARDHAASGQWQMKRVALLGGGTLDVELEAHVEVRGLTGETHTDATRLQIVGVVDVLVVENLVVGADR